MRCGAPALIVGNEPFAVLLPDEYAVVSREVSCLKHDGRCLHEPLGGNVIAVEEVPARTHAGSYGIVDAGGGRRVARDRSRSA